MFDFKNKNYFKKNTIKLPRTEPYGKFLTSMGKKIS